MRALLARSRELLEAMWDCTCTDTAACERCQHLSAIDAALAKR